MKQQFQDSGHFNRHQKSKPRHRFSLSLSLSALGYCLLSAYGETLRWNADVPAFVCFPNSNQAWWAFFRSFWEEESYCPKRPSKIYLNPIFTSFSTFLFFFKKHRLLKKRSGKKKRPLSLSLQFVGPWATNFCQNFNFGQLYHTFFTCDKFRFVPSLSWAGCDMICPQW